MSVDNSPLAIALSAAVPLYIAEIKQRGGLSQADMDRLPSISQLLGEQGDMLLFKSTKPGQTAHVLNEVAFGLAVLAFAPGGVRFGTMRFEA